MADEYYDRYRRLSHTELYRQLAAGSPARVDAVVNDWRTVEVAVQALAAALRGDLAGLAHAWTGQGSREYQHRVGLIATWAQQLADEAVAIRTGLRLMSTSLAEAQRKAEPDQAEPEEWAADGVLGPALGHTASAQERGRAHDRLAQLVADLAAAYGLAQRHHWVSPLPLAPPDLPGTDPAAEQHEHEHRHVSLHHHHSAPVTHLAHAHASGRPAVDHTPVTTVAAAAAAMLSGVAGVGVAAGAAAHVVSHQAQRGTAESAPAAATSANTTSPATAGGPMPMMGASAVGAPMAPVAPIDSSGATAFRPFQEANAWSASETVGWTEAEGEAPPPVLT